MFKYLMRQNNRWTKSNALEKSRYIISSQLPFSSRYVILSKRQYVYLTRFIFLETLLAVINCILPSNSLLIEFCINHYVLLGIKIRLSGLLFLSHPCNLFKIQVPG